MIDFSRSVFFTQHLTVLRVTVLRVTVLCVTVLRVTVLRKMPISNHFILVGVFFKHRGQFGEERDSLLVVLAVEGQGTREHPVQAHHLRHVLHPPHIHTYTHKRIHTHTHTQHTTTTPLAHTHTRALAHTQQHHHTIITHTRARARTHH